MAVKVTLKKINVKLICNQRFTYDILKHRYANHEVVNIPFISSNKLPTFKEHVKHITKSKKYKAFYKIMLGTQCVGLMYLDTNNIHGTFIPFYLIKKAIKYYKEKNIEVFSDKTCIAAAAVYELYRINPKIKTFFAKVNINNPLSIKALIGFGYRPIELTLVMETINGIAIDHRLNKPMICKGEYSKMFKI